MFSDKKHLSVIIASISWKSLKKALIKPKTSLKGLLVHFCWIIFFYAYGLINQFNKYIHINLV